MESNETTGAKRRFFNRRMAVLFSAVVVALAVVTGLLLRVNAPRNEILSTMPGTKSKVNFLEPVVQAIWKFEGQFNQRKPVSFRCYQLDTTRTLSLNLGIPVLTNDAGIMVWIVSVETAKSAAAQSWPNDRGSEHPYDGRIGNDTVFERAWSRVCGTAWHQGVCRARILGNRSFDLEVFLTPNPIHLRKPRRTGVGAVSTNQPTLIPFGVRATVPRGSALVILGPQDNPAPIKRYGGVIIPW